MATFEVQVEGLTGLEIASSTSSPTRDELTQFLKDGVIDVTNRCVDLNPNMAELFIKEINPQSYNGYKVDGAKLVSVLREAGTQDDWRPCKQIPIGLKNRVQDKDSLHFASKYSPVYIVESNGSIHVYPIPVPTIGRYQIYYVNDEPVDKNYDELTWNTSSIGYFDDSKVYLVVMYASIKSLQNALASKDNDLPSEIDNIVLENVSTSLPTYSGPTSFILPVPPAGADVDFSSIGSVESFVSPVFSAPTLGNISAMSLPSVPVTPSLSAASVSITGDAPTYTAPVLSLGTAPSISDLSISTVVPVPPALTTTTVNESSITAPTFNPPFMGELDYNDADTWINTEEDSEMLQSRMAEISTRIQEYQGRLQESTAEFQKNNVIFQKDLDIAVSNSQLESEDDAQKLQKYGQEVQSYTSEVNKQVQEYQLNLEGDLRVWESERSTDLQKYSADIQNNLNVFNKENIEYQAKLQKDLTDAQLTDANESKKIQLYQSDLQTYQAEVNKEVQRWTGEVFNKEFNEWSQKYQGQLQEYSTNIQNETSRISASLSEYQVKVNKDLQTYQSETGYDISIYQNQIQANVAKFQNDLTKNSTEFQSNLEKYMGEVQKVTSVNQSKIADFGNKVQDYSMRLQKQQLNYGWMESRMMKIQQDYDTAFQIMAPRQQQGEQ